MNANGRFPTLNFAQSEEQDNALAHTQRLAGVGMLTAGVAHELSNPLTVITAACSNLTHQVSEQQLSQAELIRNLELIEQNAFRGAQIINVLRNYLHDESQAAITELAIIEQDALTLLKHQFASQSNVQIESKFPYPMPSIICDHNRIQQVLINLLTNARDAMQPKGGTIHLRFWPVNKVVDSLILNGLPDRDWVAFSVKDSGSGIEPDVMDKLFEPFFTTKSHGSGAGLGLFVAQRIIAAHNGRIWAENNPDGGATFTVLLPQRQREIGD